MPWCLRMPNNHGDLSVKSVSLGTLRWTEAVVWASLRRDFCSWEFSLGGWSWQDCMYQTLWLFIVAVGKLIIREKWTGVCLLRNEPALVLFTVGSYHTQNTCRAFIFGSFHKNCGDVYYEYFTSLENRFQKLPGDNYPSLTLLWLKNAVLYSFKMQILECGALAKISFWSLI